MQSDFRIALHEASHLVVASLLNLRVSSAVVRPDGTGNVSLAERDLGTQIGGGELTPPPNPTLAIRRLLRRHILVRLAGIAGPRMMACETDTSSSASDWTTARRLAFALAPEEPEICLAWYLRVCARILRRYVTRGVIHELAADLVSAPAMTLTGPALATWMVRVIFESRLSSLPASPLPPAAPQTRCRWRRRPPVRWKQSYRRGSEFCQ